MTTEKSHAEFFTGIRNGLWDRKHFTKMGNAVWLFGWAISRQTIQDGSAGLVFGGYPLTIQEICKDMGGASRRVVQKWLGILRREGYIRTKRVSRGIIITICKAKKKSWAQSRLFPDAHERAHHQTADTKSCASEVPDRAHHSTRSCASPPSLPIYEIKEGNQRRKSKGAQASPSLFQTFWEAYPRKVGKPAALRAWKKIKANEVEAILKAIVLWQRSEQWQSEKYIPHPATFLNQERWKDQPPKKELTHARQRTKRNLQALGFIPLDS